MRNLSSAAVLLTTVVFFAANAALSQPTPDLTFDHFEIEDVTAEHPNVGDIDLDGRNDIVIVTRYVDAQGGDYTNPKDITVYTAPNWEKHVILTLNYRADDLDLADMDGDGDLDIVGRAAARVGEDEDDAMNFWLENPGRDGDPLRDEWLRHDIGRSDYVKDLDVADLNGDWKPDFLARTDASLYIWLKEDKDTWNGRRLDIHPHEGMKIADLDSDGDPDVILNGFWLETPENPLEDEWTEHTIDDRWYTQETGKWMDNSSRIDVADIDGDGRLDVLLSHSENAGYPVSWYSAEDPKGTWTEHEIGRIDYAHTLKAGDMDLDGDIDVVAGELIHSSDPNPDGPHPLVVFLNEGDGLTWRTVTVDQRGVYNAEIGDLDDEGDLDIIGPRNWNMGPINVWRNTAGDTAASRVPFTFRVVDSDPPSRHVFVGAADLSGDGNPDILAYSGGEEGYLSFYEYPSYERRVIYEGDFHAERPIAADIDGDGDLDVFVGKGERTAAHWYENPAPEGDPRSTWIEHFIGETDGRVKDYACDDFDGDGRLDLVFAGYDSTYIFFQDGKDSWARNAFTYVNGHEGMDVGDLDGDGDPDVVTNGRWFETPDNSRTGTFIEHEIDEKWHNQDIDWRKNSTMTRVADVDGNGRLDVVFTHSELPGYPVSWYSAEDPKNGPWIEHIIDPDFGWAETLDLGDVDGDGDLDVLTGRFERDNERPYDYWLSDRPYAIRIYYNEGDGLDWTMQQVSTFGIYNGHLVDIGNDGDLDIVGPRSYWTGPLYIFENRQGEEGRSQNDWNYIRVDSTRTRYDGKESGGGGWFGLAMGDVTGDGYQDIASGKWFYRNPGGDMTGAWERITLEDGIDNLLIVDVDGDEYGDIIGARCNEQFWLEATDREGTEWMMTRIGTLPVCDHQTSSQGYNLAQLVAGGRPEVILAGDGIFYLEIPDDPSSGPWPATTVLPGGNNGEWVSPGDMDGDGDLDIVGAYNIGDEGIGIAWWENPGDGSGNWRQHEVGRAEHYVDKVIAADVDGDGHQDLVVTEERWPGREPDANMFWFESPGDPKKAGWKRHKIVTQYTMNNLDVADVDGDGDPDIVTGEHKGPRLFVQLWENDGHGNFRVREIDRGKENHLGTRLTDLDRDGDLDLVGIAWDAFQDVHVWRNDTPRR